MSFKFFLSITLIIIAVQAESEDSTATTQAAASSEEDDMIITSSVVMFSILLIGFLWLFYENNRKLNLESRAIDNAKGSRLSAVSNSYTAVPGLLSPRTDPQKTGDSDEFAQDEITNINTSIISVKDTIENTPTVSGANPDVVDRKFTPALDSTFMDEEALRKKSTVQAITPSTSELKSESKDSKVELSPLPVSQSSDASTERRTTITITPIEDGKSGGSKFEDAESDIKRLSSNDVHFKDLAEMDEKADGDVKSESMKNEEARSEANAVDDTALAPSSYESRESMHL